MNSLTVPNSILLEEVAAGLDKGREAVITPTGNSMLPFIRGGRDRVVLRKAPSVAPGDIVLARLDGRYVLHRVLSVSDGVLTLMGDGNIRGTETCTSADVIGTAVEIIRPDGRRRTPGKGRLWQAVKPVRRYILAIYRRLI